MKYVSFLLIFLFSLFPAQKEGLSLPLDVKKEIIPFRFISNLIFIPVSINGVELTFLLDTGVNETLLLSYDSKQVNLENIEKMQFSGLGENLNIQGLKSVDNIVKVGEHFADRQHTVFIILDEDFNFSSHIGIPVHGIIGYNFFRNQPVEIDYVTKQITVYNPSQKIQRKVRRHEVFPVSIEDNKPHILAEVQMKNERKTSKLLIDSGNSDALWLFPSLIKDFVYNRPNIDDYLGRGFNGDIHGKRSRIRSFSLGKFSFDKPQTAMPYEYSIQNVRLAKDRKGSLGGEILRRFNVFFDYPSSKIYLRRNSFYSQAFTSNMSGLDFKHDGITWENEKVKMNNPLVDPVDIKGVSVIQNSFQYKMNMRPQFTIAGVRADSPAYRAGLRKDDKLLEINGELTSGMTLEKLNFLMSHEEGKKLDFTVIRNSETLKFSFKLEDPIPYTETL